MEIGTRILYLLIIWVIYEQHFSSTCNAALFEKTGYGKKNGRRTDLSKESCTLEDKAITSAEWVWICNQARGDMHVAKSPLMRVLARGNRATGLI